MIQQHQKLKSTKHKRGFTLIEVIVFIVVMGIISVTIFASLNTLLRGSTVSQQQTVAVQAATQCMEWYVGQRILHGFNAATLPIGSATPNICKDLPVGYDFIISTDVKYELSNSYDPNYKTIYVYVSDKSGKSLSSLSLLLAAY
ncbi:conserved hypothetical protein [Gammaproteobacteria bacterium]